ncbi:MAG TPA: ATP-binding cassette domain-containing protein, partial [Candidatus Obscuribacterales bacterium]
ELEIDSATHAFGARKVLKGAWLKCRGGEIIGLLGRNGCGKSTLLQILFGTQQADFRALFLNGKPLARPYLIPGLIAYLPQPSFLPRYLRVRQAIRLFGGRQGLEKLSREPRILEMLATRVSQLSGGEKRFLELGLILSLDRLFVLLDEPFSELEPLYKQRVREWIKEEAAAGKGIVVTDHDYRQILEVGQRVVLMTQGQTRPVANLKELDRIYLPLDT